MNLLTKSICTVFTALLLISNSQAQSEEKTAALKAQLQKIPTPIQSPFTETESIIKDGKTTTTITKFDYSQTPTWNLISVDGQNPSKKQLKKFKKKIEQGEEDNKKNPFLSILNIESISYLKTETDLDIYSFNPVFADFKDEAKFMIDGRVFVDQNNKITRILIDAPEKFSPVFSVSMSTFLIDYDIAYHKDIPYVSYYELMIDGKIGGFKKLKMQSNARYSDIQW